MPGPADHFLVALLVLLLPPRAWVSFRALRLAAPGQQPALRRRTYIAASLSQWMLCGLLALYWMRMARSWPALGLSAAVTPGTIGAAIGLVVVVVVMVLRWRKLGPDATIAAARERLAHVESMLPHTRGELALFRALSITAGICEELLFRGFLIWYLTHYTGLIQAAVLSSFAFGLGHAYQGPRGIGMTALVGAFMAAVYLITGSLILPIVLHALMDGYAGWLGYRAFGNSKGDAARGAGGDGSAPAPAA